MTPEQIFRPAIRALTAYHVADATGLIKLDAMENPYPWPGELLPRWLEIIAQCELNRYPDPSSRQLRQRLRETFTIPASMEILVGNGSDELIQLIMLALADDDRTVLAPSPSFAMYPLSAEFCRLRFVGVPLNPDDFSLDLRAMLEAIERYQPIVVFLAYPNNPTGNRFDPESVRRIIAAAPGLVVIDEAYYAFSQHSFLGEIEQFDNVLLLRTVSKIGLAGLRLGLLVGAERWLREINKLRLPYNINTLTQCSVEFALCHHAVLVEQGQRIIQARAELATALEGFSTLKIYPSETNFILFRTPAGQAERLHRALKQAGILLKDLSTSGDPLLADCLRLTVGNREQNNAFLATLAAALPA